jgi:hypothetical protein
MNGKVIQPLVTAPGFPENGGIVFITATQEVTIHGHTAEIMKILRLCNGQRELSAIASECGVETTHFEELVQLLTKHQIICDSRELYMSAVTNSSYPLIATHDLGQKEISALVASVPHSRKLRAGTRICLSEEVPDEFTHTLFKRKSCRGFKDESITEPDLSKILHIAYRCSGAHRPVPSAGKLYPLQIVEVCIGMILQITNLY